MIAIISSLRWVLIMLELHSQKPLTKNEDNAMPYALRIPQPQAPAIVLLILMLVLALSDIDDWVEEEALCIVIIEEE